MQHDDYFPYKWSDALPAAMTLRASDQQGCRTGVWILIAKKLVRDNDTSVQPQPRKGSRNGGSPERSSGRRTAYDMHSMGCHVPWPGVRAANTADEIVNATQQILASPHFNAKEVAMDNTNEKRLPIEKMFTRKDAAQILGISIDTLDQVRRDGLISYVQYVENGSVYFTETGLREFIARCTHRAKPINNRLTYRNPRR